MAEKKNPELSIIIRTVDKATARIKAINERLDAATKPAREFKEAFSELREKSGFDSVVAGFGNLGSALMDVVGKVAMVGGLIAGAVAGVLSLIDGFDDLGDKAEQFGVSVDFIAQMRYAAEKSGGAVEELDAGLQSFTTSLGQARAGTGKMTGFLKIVSPRLLEQLKLAKSNEEAFGLLARAMAKIQDPAKRAAFAAKTVGSAALAPLLARGADGIGELRKRYLELAGSQEEAAAAAGPVDDALKDMKATTDGLKAAIVRGMAPAMTIIIKKLSDWFVKNRGKIEKFAAEIGQRIPAAFDRLVNVVGDAVQWVTNFVDKVVGAKTVLYAVVAVMVGPLLSAVASLLVSLGTFAALMGGPVVAAVKAIGLAMSLNPFTVWVVAIAALAALIPTLLDEIEKFKAALDTSNEVLIEDSVKMSDQAFAAAHPAIASEKEDGARLARGEMTLEEYGKRYPGKGTQETLDFFRYTNGVQAATTEAKVTIDIANAPKGTRVTTDPQSTANVDLSVGYAGAGL